MVQTAVSWNLDKISRAIQTSKLSLWNVLQRKQWIKRRTQKRSFGFSSEFSKALYRMFECIDSLMQELLVTIALPLVSHEASLL